MLNLEVNTHTFDGVKRQARNRWNELLVAAGIDARALRNNHGPCPGCGGKDRFRYDDKDGDGTFICSQGNGNTLAGDGFELLQHVGIAQSSQEALHLVAGLLGGTNSQATKLNTEFVYCRPDGIANLKVIRTDTSDGKRPSNNCCLTASPQKQTPILSHFLTASTNGH